MIDRPRPSAASAQAWARRESSAILWTALFFGSLMAVFAFLIWIANRYPAAPYPATRTFRGAGEMMAR